MDVRMPGIGGLEATPRPADGAGPKVIARPSTRTTLSHTDARSGRRRLRHQGRGHPRTVGHSQGGVGQRYLSSDIARQIALRSYEEQDVSPFTLLSGREMQIATMVVNCRKVQEISDSLCLSPKTVNSYRYRIFEKLNISSDLELTLLAMKHGMVDPHAVATDTSRRRPTHDPACRRCRASRHASTRSEQEPDWHCAPVPSWGEGRARLLIAGLAPGRARPINRRAVHRRRFRNLPVRGPGALRFRDCGSPPALALAIAWRTHHERGPLPAAGEPPDAGGSTQLQTLLERRTRAPVRRRSPPRGNAGPRPRGPRSRLDTLCLARSAAPSRMARPSPSARTGWSLIRFPLRYNTNTGRLAPCSRPCSSACASISAI